MSDLTPAEAAILGLLAEGSAHAYELDELIEKRGLRAWTSIGFSSIYFLLQKLLKRGLIRENGSATSPKAKKPFHITPEGRHALATACLEFIEKADAPRPPVLVGLANWPGLDPESGLRSLRQRRHLIEGDLVDLRKRRADQAPLPVFVDALFTFGIIHAEAELVWLDDTIEKLGASDE